MFDRRLFAVAVLGTALGALHQALIGSGSPRAVDELGGADIYILVPAAYLVATAIGAMGAWVLDRHRSASELLVLALGLFAAGAGLAAVSGAMWQLVVARAVAGLGAGALFAITLALARSSHSRHGVAAAAYVGAFAAGPLLGDIATEAVGWRPAFAVSFVVAIVALLVVAFATGSRVPLEPPAAGVASDGGSAGAGRGALALLGAALVGAALFVPIVFLPIAGSIRITGGDGVPTLALPLAIGAVLGALLAARLPAAAGLRPEIPLGALIVVVALLARLAAPTSLGGAAGWLTAAAIGLGGGLMLAGASWLVLGAAGARVLPLEAAARQLGGLVGLGIGAGALFGTLLDRLVANLRPIVDEVVAQVPSDYQFFARAAAEDALRTLGRELSAANIGGGEPGDPQTFADIVIARIPTDFQSLAAPYVDRLNGAFADALTAALSAAFTAGALLAAVALVVGFAASWLVRDRPIRAR
jgi:predicted MFS family arabinose efflux permease